LNLNAANKLKMQNLNKAHKYSHTYQFEVQIPLYSTQKCGISEVQCDITLTETMKIERNLAKGRNLKCLCNVNKNANTEFNWISWGKKAKHRILKSERTSNDPAPVGTTPVFSSECRGGRCSGVTM